MVGPQAYVKRATKDVPENCISTPLGLAPRAPQDGMRFRAAEGNKTTSGAQSTQSGQCRLPLGASTNGSAPSQSARAILVRPEPTLQSSPSIFADGGKSVTIVHILTRTPLLPVPSTAMSSVRDLLWFERVPNHSSTECRCLPRVPYPSDHPIHCAPPPQETSSRPFVAFVT
jgi:hypothetical protein